MSTITITSGVTVVPADWGQDVNNVVYTALGAVAGAGTITKVQFPATQVASSDANALDDYEEGIFTVGVTFGGAAVGVTYGAQVGIYTKVGRLVAFGAHLTLTSKGSSTGAALITGLPFVLGGAAEIATSVGYANNFASGIANIIALVTASTQCIRPYKFAAGASTQLQDTDFSNTSDIYISGTFTVI